MSDRTTTIATRALDALPFREWLTCQLGYYFHPSRDGVLLLYLHQQSVLRLVTGWSHQPVPITVPELLQDAGRINSLLAGDRIPKTLAQIARLPDGPRLVLEAEQQRRRLFPRFAAWIRQNGPGLDSARMLDIYVLRFRGHARFSDLALIAELAPTIGPGLLLHLFQHSSSHAARLLTRWARAGEWSRLAHVGEPLEFVVEQLAGTRHQAAIAAVRERVVELHAERSAG